MIVRGRAVVLRSVRWSSTSILSHYESLVKEGELKKDPRQEAVINILDSFQKDVIDWGRRRPSIPTYQPPPPPKQTSFWSRWFDSTPPPRPPVVITGAPKGVYMFGSVGCGKTMLMDMLYETTPVSSKQRVSFHTFMLDVHARVAAWRSRNITRGEALQPHTVSARAANASAAGERMMEAVATELVQKGWFMCFDEFQVTDIANAVILRSLFEALLDRGAVVVATSNRPPDELYLGGLQRPLILPFLELLKQRNRVVHLDSDTDYRRMLAEAAQYDVKKVFVSPLGPLAESVMEKLFLHATGGAKGGPTTLPVMMGRTLKVARAHDGVGWFSFDELCRNPVYSADYLAVCDRFHTVFLYNVPVMSQEMRNEVRRFVTLIDQLYERKVRLVMSAAAVPMELYRGEKRIEQTITGGKKPSYAEDEAFAFDRTVSRLLEMQSTEYLEENAELAPQWQAHSHTHGSMSH